MTFNYNYTQEQIADVMEMLEVNREDAIAYLDYETETKNHNIWLEDQHREYCDDN